MMRRPRGRVPATRGESSAARHGPQIRALILIRLGEAEDPWLGFDAPVAACLPVDRRPPVFMPGQPLVAHGRPVAEDLRPALVAVVEGLLPVADLRDVPFAAELG